jgi:hypothetical protein
MVKVTTIRRIDRMMTHQASQHQSVHSHSSVRRIKEPHTNLSKL